MPEGAVVVGLAGTAPALVARGGRLRRGDAAGPAARAAPALAARARDGAAAGGCSRASSRPSGACCGSTACPSRPSREALAAAGGDGDGVEATICARDFEIHVDLVVEPGAGARADELEAALAEPLAEYVFSREAEPIEALVLDAVPRAGADARDGRVVHGRARRGAADLGARVERRVPRRGRLLRERGEGVGARRAARRCCDAHGAVSAETAAAMAAGARARLGADVAVAVTGIAGPGGGSPEKPVGLVYLHAAGPGGERALDFNAPGDRETVRARAAVAALHLVRKLVTEL